MYVQQPTTYWQWTLCKQVKANFHSTCLKKTPRLYIHLEFKTLHSTVWIRSGMAPNWVMSPFSVLFPLWHTDVILMLTFIWTFLWWRSYQSNQNTTTHYVTISSKFPCWPWNCFWHAISLNTISRYILYTIEEYHKYYVVVLSCTYYAQREPNLKR